MRNDAPPWAQTGEVETLDGTAVPTENAYVTAFVLAAVAGSIATAIAIPVSPVRRRGRANRSAPIEPGNWQTSCAASISPG